MRIKTFSAPTIAEAMDEVRHTLGPDAIIISTFEAKRGRGVEVCAAVEGNTAPLPTRRKTSPEESAPALTTELTSALSETPLSTDTKGLHHLLGQARRTKVSALATNAPTPIQQSMSSHDIDAHIETLTKALHFHNCSRQLSEALLSAFRALEPSDIESALTQVCELRFSFAPIPLRPSRPLLFVGPAGTGKTAVTAKLAARALLQGADPHIFSTDTIRAGAVEQLSSLTKAMNRQIITAESPKDLNQALYTCATKEEASAVNPYLIDSPATNPYIATEMEDLSQFITESDAEPVLVLAAGGDYGELSDTCSAFAELGVQRVILTRLDSARRLGSSLSALDATGLALANYSDSPYVGRGLDPFTSNAISARLLTLPQPYTGKLGQRDNSSFERKAP